MGGIVIIDFPDNPLVGDLYIFNSKTWAFNGEGWQQVGNFGAFWVIAPSMPRVVAPLTGSSISWVPLTFV